MFSPPWSRGLRARRGDTPILRRRRRKTAGGPLPEASSQRRTIAVLRILLGVTQAMREVRGPKTEGTYDAGPRSPRPQIGSHASSRRLHTPVAYQASPLSGRRRGETERISVR